MSRYSFNNHLPSARPRPALVALLLFSAACISRDPAPPPAALHSAALQKRVVQVDTLQRTYSVYVPPSVRPSPAVVLALHGGSGGSGARLRGFVGNELESAAEEGGFIVVYPDGVAGSWNDCRRGASYPAKRLNVDDVRFVHALIDRLERDHGADRRRVFAFGYSNGGQLAFRVAIESPGTLRGIAVVGANLPAADAFDCRASPAPLPLPVLLVAGTADAISPYRGGGVVLPDGTMLGRVRSARETLRYFAELAAYDDVPAAWRVSSTDPETGTGVEWLGFAGEGPEVALVTVHGGGHTIPSAEARFPEWLGATERRASAVREAGRVFGLVTP